MTQLSPLPAPLANGSPSDKLTLFRAGIALMERFCAINDIPAPVVQREASKDWRVPFCAYYRKDTIFICLERCSPLGTAASQWSCPGYTVDRTPYGVVQHELGHHIDVLRSKIRGPYYGDFSVNLRKETGEDKISSYCPNDAEWFAEIFRVFVTNPGLLQLMRPRTYHELTNHFKPVFHDTWQERLAGCPDRTLAMANRKVETSQASGSLV